MGDGEALEAEAFQRLYPNQYYAKFIEQGLRPDGRPLGRARPASVGFGMVTTADASALVKLGSSTAMAGVKCAVAGAAPDVPDAGTLAVQVELAPLSSRAAQPGRPSEAALVLTDQLQGLLLGVVDLQQLCIDPGKAAWSVHLDIYVLDADGSLLDACVLAALAALSSLRLSVMTFDEASGSMRPAAAAEAGDGPNQQQQQRALALQRRPVALTCALYGGRLIVDPTAEEERLAGALVSTAVDEAGTVLGMFKPGGAEAADLDQLQGCYEAARMRSSEVLGILDAALQQHLAAAAAAAGQVQQ